MLGLYEDNEKENGSYCSRLDIPIVVSNLVGSLKAKTLIEGCTG